MEGLLDYLDSAGRAPFAPGADRVRPLSRDSPRSLADPCRCPARAALDAPYSVS
jgi:hypothetical protein